MLSFTITSAAYGDGSAGLLEISTDTDWTANPPKSMNFQFLSIVVNPGVTWKIPSGLTIRTLGDFVVNGSVIVAAGPTALLEGDDIPPGVSLAALDDQGQGGAASALCRPRR